MIDLIHWGLWGIALMYALEAAGLPWPIEIPMWVSGEMLRQGTAEYWHLVLATWLGTSVGGAVMLALIRTGGRRLLAWLSVRFNLQQRTDKVRAWTQRYGLGALILTRWTNWGLGPSLLLIGVSPIPTARILTVMLLNNLIWAFAWVAFSGFVVGTVGMMGLPTWLILTPPAAIFTVWLARGLWLKYRPRPAE